MSTSRLVTTIIFSISSLSSLPAARAAGTTEAAKARWESYRKDSRPWTVFAFEQMSVVAPRLLTSVPADIVTFCPSYASLDEKNRKNFWIYLLSAMTHFESYYDPSVKYVEKFVDAKGNRVVSRGLLQISGESGRSYGCLIPEDMDLHDPYVNLTCGMKILERWVASDRVISGKSGGKWRGGARYWSVLRNHLSTISKWTSAQDYCR